MEPIIEDPILGPKSNFSISFSWALRVFLRPRLRKRGPKMSADFLGRGTSFGEGGINPLNTMPGKVPNML